MSTNILILMILDIFKNCGQKTKKISKLKLYLNFKASFKLIL